MRVWIDQDLCTGDGLCTDHCPPVFVLLEDGISYVRDVNGVVEGPGGRSGIVDVPARYDDDVIAAATVCPGECIFVEIDEDPRAPADDDDVVPAELVDRVRAAAVSGGS